MTKAQVMARWRQLSEEQEDVVCACSIGVFEWMFGALFCKASDNVYVRANKTEALRVASELLDGSATLTVRGKLYEMEGGLCAA